MMMKECHWVEIANIAMFLSSNVKLTSEKMTLKTGQYFQLDGLESLNRAASEWRSDEMWLEFSAKLYSVHFLKISSRTGFLHHFCHQLFWQLSSSAYIWLCFECIQKWTKIVFCTLRISPKLDWLTWFLNCNCAIIQKTLNCVLPAFISPHSPTRLHHCHVKAVIELSEFHLCLHNRSTSLLASIHLSPPFLLSPLASCCFFPFLLHTLPKTYKTKS